MLVVSLELVCIEDNLDVRLFLLALVDAHLNIILRGSDERIYLVKIFLLVQQDSSLKDFILTGRDIRDAGVDHHFLLGVVDELQGVGRLVNVEEISVNLIVDRNFLLLVFSVLAHRRIQCGFRRIIICHDCCVALCATLILTWTLVF